MSEFQPSVSQDHAHNNSENVHEPLAAFVSKASIASNAEGNFRFQLRRSELEKETGVPLYEGKLYDIKDTIAGIGDLDVWYVGAKKERMFLYVPNRYRESVKAGETYSILIDSIEQRKTFRVETIRGWPLLTLRHSALQSAGLPPGLFSREKRGILELGLRKLSPKGEPAKKVFASIQFNRQNEVVHLHVSKIGAKHGDLFELLRAREYLRHQFIKDFNGNLPEGMNARLESENEMLGLEVNGRHFAFTESHLNPYNLELCLSARFQEGKRQFRFWFDGENSRAEFDGIGKIKRFVATENRLKFVYVPREREVTAVRRPLQPEIDLFATARIMDKVRLVSKAEGDEREYAFEVDPALYRHVNSILSSVETKAERIAARGKIAEEVSPAILALAGWEEIWRHPSKDQRQRAGSTDPGPDSLMRRGSTLSFIEHKWYTNPEQAFKEAREQLEGYKDYDIGPETRNVKDAFAAVLDWDPTSARGRLRVRMAWSKDDSPS